MSSEYVERVVLRVNGVDLDDVILEVDEDSNRPTKPVNTMNKARTVRGFKQGNNMYSLTIKAERIVDSRIPDWHALKDAGTKIGVIVEPNVGNAVSYGGVLITSVKDTTTDGDSTRTITAVAKTRK